MDGKIKASPSGGTSGESRKPALAVLFMAGEFDEARPERLAEYQKRIPGSRLEIIADAAHASLSKKPDEYRTILESFLDSVEAKKALHE